MNPTRVVVILFLLLSGCSSCQRSEEESAGGGGPGGRAVATPPGAAGAQGKIQVAPVAPTIVARVPRPPGEGGAPAGAAPGAPTEGEKGAEGDCIVVIDANPDYGPPPLAVAFSAEAECSSGEPTIKWSFGDGSEAATEMNPSHTYTKPGDYVASATVTSPSGATASDEIDITVEEGEAAPQ